MNVDYKPYLGDDLGATYTKQNTKFVLWAPISSKVILHIENKNGLFDDIELEKIDDVTFATTVKGNLLNRKYFYTVTNNGVEVDTNDPWGKGTSLNSKYSAVVDIDKIKKMRNVKPKTVINSPLDAIIYELNIRDFTEDKHTDIADKRHYLGMVEEGRKTLAGHPAGIDYLKYLGITHIQILPIMDFGGADDINPLMGYNWGYNPISYFAIEGSYSHSPAIPESRLVEFKTMVNKLHKNDIRVIMDVVYNHVYEYKNTHWQKLVPDYFFRFNGDGSISQSSGCGNDFASEKAMCRKMIIDSIKYFVEVFDVDGFRFDLMGITDYETINLAYEEAKKIKPDIIFYGEGWNMPTALPDYLRASADNFEHMPNIGFFNDTFRDAIKGSTFDLAAKGYISGNLSNNSLIDYVFKAGVVDGIYRRRFLYPHQSINYVECHDNHTLYDKLIVANYGEDDSSILQRVKFANTITMISFGVPFFHMGQEIGQSKFGLGNSYNVIKINNLSYKLLDQRFDMAIYFHLLTELRKKLLTFLKLDDPLPIGYLFKSEEWMNGLYRLTSEDNPYIKPYKKIIMVINPNNETKQYEFDDYYTYMTAKDIKKRDKTHVKNGIINACTIQIFYKYEDEQ